MDAMLPARKTRIINIKLSDAEYDAMKDRAQRWTDGNVSAWLRHAALSFQPNVKKDAGVVGKGVKRG